LKKDKQKAFEEKLEDLRQRFQKTSQKIKEKEQLFIDLATNRDSQYSNNHDNERTAAQIAEKQQSLKLIAETDNMEEVIKQRKQDINKIESIMQNINAIAKDINVEVQNQGEKLVRLDQHMTSAANNV